MNSTGVQIRLFQHLKSVLPPHLSMVDEVAEVLGISTDSAYRRIRGEKPLSLDELHAICTRYRLSIDQHLQLLPGNFLFSGELSQNNEEGFDKWIDSLYKQLSFMNSFSRKRMYWLLKDISPFAHFQIDELAAFKFFLWMKSILDVNSMKGVRFDPSDGRYTVYLDKSRKILEIFNQIPGTEIWNVESINSTLRQIRFHHDSGSFSSPSIATLLYTRLEELIDHIEAQAEAGKKFMIGQQPGAAAVDYEVFVNELILGDNTIFLEADDVRMSFLNHSVLSFIHTRDELFNDRMYDNLQILMKKSTLVSRVGEKDRISFFNRLRKSIANHKDL